jgi:energy-converting hydrogenase Eha subunit C
MHWFLGTVSILAVVIGAVLLLLSANGLQQIAAAIFLLGGFLLLGVARALGELRAISEALERRPDGA